MALPDIDFKSIREHAGSRDRGFEELCCQLAALLPRSGGEFFRKGPGADAGVECFVRHPGGQETGWQVKYYWKMDGSLTASLDDSIETALSKHPQLDTYIVCLPFDLPDPRTGTRSAIDTWTAWKNKWIAKAKAESRPLTIELWSASKLKELLTRDQAMLAGRILYWFNAQVLTPAWFRGKFETVKQDLGSRYTAETNVRLPIRRALLGLARDPALQASLDDWLPEYSRKLASAVRAVANLSGITGAPASAKLETALRAMHAALVAPLPTPAQEIPTNSWRTLLASARDEARAAYLWSLDAAISSDNEAQRSGRDYAIQATREVIGTLGDLQELLTGELWSQVNARTALVTGEGGIGKSHLLADVVAHQVERDRPAVLLLGQHFLDDDPWPQIVRRLGLPQGTTTEQFLGAMDAAAQAAGVRGLIAIDALNEKHGVHLWHDRLAGFLHAFETFPHLAVILSCRTTYLPQVIPDTLGEDRLSRLVHHGFGLADTRAYLAMRGITLPGAPVPAPGFENPLILKTCCDALERDGRRVFPRGLTGTTAVFDFYLDTVIRQVNNRLKLAERRNHVRRAIDRLAREFAEAESEYASVARVQELFDEILPSDGGMDSDLLTQLESEGVLFVEATGDGEEIVRFTFQRFSDHVIAAHLLDTHLDTACPADAFAVGGGIHRFVSDPLVWDYSGVLEALAVQLPERIGKELPDLAPDKTRHPIWHAFQQSLLWRDQKCFSNRTLELVRDGLGEDAVLPTLIQIATEPDNQYNALFLHRGLMAQPMPERDAQWSTEIAEMGADSDGPLGTLIEWAWESGFDVIDDRRAELTGIALAWCLTTSSRVVRDRATKALTALLAPRPGLAAELLRRFWTVDDDYLRERLLAAIYGSVMQGMTEPAELEALALTIYGIVFENDAPPVNALLRDHARWTIEYAAVRGCLPASIDLAKARPPYRSPWPLEVVPKELMDGYQQTYRTGARGRDEIVGSCVNDGDFARYVIDYHVGHWSPAPIGSKQLPTHQQLAAAWQKDFRKAASKESKKAFARLEKCRAEAKGQAEWAKTPERKAVQEAHDAFLATLTPEARQDYLSRTGAWRRGGMFNHFGGSGPAHFDMALARRWVCKRAHELGWSDDLHGHFDTHSTRSRDRMSHSVERIGKKYQWLALYELGARLADNCAFIGDRYGRGPVQSYDGESFGSLRDVDPSLLRWRRETDEPAHTEPAWWSPIHPRFHPVSNEDRLGWLYGDEDRIDSVHCIETTDSSGCQWLTLDAFTSIREKTLGEAEAERDTWSRLTCMVVRKRDLPRAIRILGDALMMDSHTLPSAAFYSGHHYFGEYPWAVEHFAGWEAVGRSATSSALRARATVVDYTCERGNFDYSIEDTINVTLPAPWLIAALGLHLSDGRRATYVDDHNGIIFFDPSLGQPGPQAGLVAREPFLAALEREGLAAFWVIAGEKNVYGETDAFGGRLSFTTLYWLKNGRWQNTTCSEFHAPTPDQVSPLFAEKVPSWVKVRKA